MRLSDVMTRRCPHCQRTIPDHVRYGKWVPCLQLDCEEWAKHPAGLGEGDSKGEGA